MIKRKIAEKLIQVAKQVPVVTIIGPRQSGKTTLVKECFSEYNYVNLEDPINRILAKEDYRGFFASFFVKLNIDEVQRVS